MGFMRKALFVSTGGLSGLAVKANSKKERTAKAAEKQVRLQQRQLTGSQRTTTRVASPSAQRSTAAKRGLKPTTRKDELAYAFTCALFGVLVAQGNSAGVALGCLLGIGAVVFVVRAYRNYPRQGTGPEREAKLVPAVRGAGVPAPSETVKHAPPETASPRPVPAASMPQSPGLVPVGSTAAEIERLAQLRAQGILSDAEFSAAKIKVLGMSTGGDA
jgi:hypothetical protein